MRILGLQHVQITVPRAQEDRAREFYAGLLGLREIPKPPLLEARGGFWLATGNLAVHVGVEDGVDRQATKAHVAYEVDDLAAVETRLREAGFAILPGLPIPGFIRFETRDPFGNRVEFLQAQ